MAGSTASCSIPSSRPHSIPNPCINIEQEIADQVRMAYLVTNLIRCCGHGACSHRSRLQAEAAEAREKEAALAAAEEEASRTKARLAAFNAALQEVGRGEASWQACWLEWCTLLEAGAVTRPVFLLLFKSRCEVSLPDHHHHKICCACRTSFAGHCVQEQV